MTELAKYVVKIRYDLPRSEFTKVDRQLKILEKRFQSFQKNFAKNFTFPEISVKKFKFDSLQLQKGAQTELNKVSRLLELKISNFSIDQQRLNKQLSGVMTRAANAARINVRSIQGSSGGSNHYIPRPHMPYAQQLGQAVGAGPFALPIPRLGVAGGVAAGVAAGAVYGVSKINEARQETATRQGQRLKLETAVGGSRERRQSYTDGLIALSDHLGITAESQVEGYSRFMKQAQSSGMKAQEGFDLYTNVATATRGNGGDQQSIERQAYALQQMLGVGYLRGEELNQQLADSNPSIKRFIMEAFAERTGKQGTEAFLDALSKRQVSVDDVLKAYEKSAKEAAGRVDELSNSIQGAEARLSNMRFGEELQRTVDGPMTEAAIQWTAAQAELHKATLPLRDAFYSAAAGATSFAATMLSKSIKQIESSPAVKGELSAEQLDTSPMSSASGRGMLGVPDIRRIQMPEPKFISPMIQHAPAWKAEAERYSKPSLQNFMPSNQSNSSSVTISPGAFVINTAASDATSLASELEPHIRGIFEQQTSDWINATMLQFPLGE